MKRFLLLIFQLLAAWSLGFAQYTLTSLDFPSGNFTTGRGINNHGDIVGAYRLRPPRHAMIFSQGSFMPLAPDTILGNLLSEAFKSNDCGDIVGIIVDNNGYTQGFLLKDGVVTILSYPGASVTYALGISELGTVVGHWNVLDADFNVLEYHGFIWKDDIFTRFDFPGAANTAIIGVNARGDMVGTYDTGIGTVGHGFIHSKGKFITFDAPFDELLVTQINAINANGRIAGIYIDKDNVEHGFVSTGAEFTTIEFPGASLTSVWDINSTGQIVGNYIKGPSTHGFFGQPGNKQKPE
jgi:uncharacterized membrane protein